VWLPREHASFLVKGGSNPASISVQFQQVEIKGLLNSEKAPYLSTHNHLSSSITFRTFMLEISPRDVKYRQISL
jgi:hypothetical protein